MKLRGAIFLIALILVSCSEKGISDGEYLRMHRDKVSAALESGVNRTAIRDVLDSLKAGVPRLDIDMSIDLGGNVSFIGTLDFAGLKERVLDLDGTLPPERYNQILAHASECIDIGMYYDGNRIGRAADIILRSTVFRDSFGEFYAYHPAFRFFNGYEILIVDFFSSDDFSSSRDEFNELLNFSWND